MAVQRLFRALARPRSNVRLRQVLRDQSLRDPLTGMFNRRYMEETLARQIACAERSGGSVSLVLLDLDHFKKINDTHGHPAGDEVLKAMGRVLAASVRAGDVACRFGGEEFILILSDCPKEAAVVKAQALCQQLAAERIAIGASKVLQVTASIGVAAFPVDGPAGHAVIDQADAALYRAKQAGRNQVAVAGAAPQAEAPEAALIA